MESSQVTPVLAQWRDALERAMILNGPMEK
jgi:hypothetical protein